MKIPSIITNNSVKLLSGLANNEDSLAAMVVKDWIGDGATVYTYKKEGGKDDAREKFIEEYGTGLVWLFGIPAFKWLIDKTVYPLLKLNSKFDPRVLDNKEQFERVSQIVKNSTSEAMKEQKEVFGTLGNKNGVFKKLTNAQMYKNSAIGKFLVSTVISAVALSTIIRYKQKTTSERINNEFAKNKKNKSEDLLLKNNIDKNETFKTFTSKKQIDNTSFTGINLAQFMYNPIKNTMILDGVITTTRLAEARKGERLEVGFKEVCQIAFIYGLAKPLQKMFEAIGNKVNCPIELDPKLLFSKDLKTKIADSKEVFKNLTNSKDILGEVSKLDLKSSAIELLDKSGAISTIKDKKGNIKAIDYMKVFDENSVKEAIKNIDKLDDNFKNLKSIKAYKIFAVIANVLIAAGIMGIIQPKLNILLRKILHNGDNRNPAIVAQEEKMKNEIR